MNINILEIENIDPDDNDINGNEQNIFHDNILEDNKENLVIITNDFETLLEDATRGTSSLLDRLLSKNNIDNYSYIKSSLKKKMKRDSITGDSKDIDAKKIIENKKSKFRRRYPKNEFSNYLYYN